MNWHTGMMADTPAAWAEQLAEMRDGDERLDPSIGRINLVWNRARLAAFLSEFSEDRDVRDLLTLDLLGITTGIPLSSTGAAENLPSLIFRPFRLWEYVSIYKTLGLSSGGLKVLDLGGPATHLSLLAAIAGSTVTSVDINAGFVDAAKACARSLKLRTLDPVCGDMRDLSRFPADSFDAVICCSVLEHLTGPDQERALREMARVVKPGGLVGLTFDYGLGAPGANEYLPPPHDPPPSAAEAVHRYSQGGLVVVGNEFSEDPLPGCLFHDPVIRYTVASLFLAKPPLPEVRTPRSEPTGSALGCLVMEALPFKIHDGARRVREMQQLSRRVPQLEEGLAATETALDGERRRAVMLEEGLASTEANRGWLLGLVQKYEAEGPLDFLLRWIGRFRRRLRGVAS